MRTVCKIQNIFTQEIDTEAGGSDLEGDCVHCDHPGDVSLHPPGAHHLGDCGDHPQGGGHPRGVILASLGGHCHCCLPPHPHYLLLSLFLYLLPSVRGKTQGKQLLTSTYLILTLYFVSLKF